MVGGFVIDENARRVLIRGLGPTLGDLGVVGALSDSQITVFKAGGREIAFNDNWGAQPNVDTIADRISRSRGLSVGRRQLRCRFIALFGSRGIHCASDRGE